MFTRTLLVFSVAAVSAGRAAAELPPLPDGLSKAYFKACRELAEGKDRQTVLNDLAAAVKAHPDSPYRRVAAPLADDLAWAVKNPPKPDVGPEGRLGETTIDYAILGYHANWGDPLKGFLAKNPDDPASRLLTADRAAIGRLLPALRDRTPTRSAITGPIDPLLRACDVALGVIEYHSKCRFFHDTIFGRKLHQLPDKEREAIVRRIEGWWTENKDKPVTAGIRAQLPHAASYPEKVWMAQNLVRLSPEKSDDREFGLETLRTMARTEAAHVGAYAARALVEVADTKTAVDIVFAGWKGRLDKPGLVRTGWDDIFFLTAHGGRREWEALAEAAGWEAVGVPNGGVAHAVVNGFPKSPYAIPIMALALDKTQMTGARYVNEKANNQPFCVADDAIAYLQKHTGKDFGYKPDGTADDRLAAIARAKKWWLDEGKSNYTFDYIERELVKKAPAAGK